MNADEVNSFSNLLKPEVAIIEGSSDRNFFSSDESSDPDIYDDGNLFCNAFKFKFVFALESGEDPSFQDNPRNPAEESNGARNETRDSETHSSAVKTIFQLCLFAFYLL